MQVVADGSAVGGRWRDPTDLGKPIEQIVPDHAIDRIDHPRH